MVDLLRLDETVKSKRSPFASFVFVDATFGSSANVDLIIEHTLTVKDAEKVRWLTITNDTSGVVYREPAPTPRAWGDGYVVLRCSVADTNVRLLLFVEQE
jgi:hypothetical protein